MTTPPDETANGANSTFQGNYATVNGLNLYQGVKQTLLRCGVRPGGFLVARKRFLTNSRMSQKRFAVQNGG